MCDLLWQQHLVYLAKHIWIINDVSLMRPVWSDNVSLSSLSFSLSFTQTQTHTHCAVVKVFTGLWADKFLSVLLHFSAKPTESYFSVSFAWERRSRGFDLPLSEPICWPASLFHVLLPRTRKDAHDGSLGRFILKLLLQMRDWKKENEKRKKKAKLRQMSV